MFDKSWFIFIIWTLYCNINIMEHNEDSSVEELQRRLISSAVCESLRKQIYESIYWELLDQEVSDITCFYVARGIAYGDEDALQDWYTLLEATWETINHEPLYHIFMQYIWNIIEWNTN